MNILFFSNWGYHDPLTTTTVLPHLELLKKLSVVHKVVLCTTERYPSISKSIDYAPHYEVASGHKITDKISDIIQAPKRLIKLCKSENIDLLICRGAPAGSFGLAVNKRLGIPFIVESMEPHAQYMKYGRQWSRFGLRYQLQSYWERQQIKKATGLITVSHKYAQYLKNRLPVAQKVQVAPCAVDYHKFQFDIDQRNLVREKLGIDKSDIVGIYSGKFGGLYYDSEAFQIFALAQSYFKRFKLLVLSTSDGEVITARLKEIGFSTKEFHVRCVPHSQVPHYLSASDFAFCLHRPHIFSMGFCPVKNGEYWANGLPVLMANRIGDDSDITVVDSVGAVFEDIDGEYLLPALEKIKNIMTEPGHRSRISTTAVKYRSFDQVERVYRFFLAGDKVS